MEAEADKPVADDRAADARLVSKHFCDQFLVDGTASRAVMSCNLLPVPINPFIRNCLAWMWVMRDVKIMIK